MVIGTSSSGFSRGRHEEDMLLGTSSSGFSGGRHEEDMVLGTSSSGFSGGRKEEDMVLGSSSGGFGGGRMEEDMDLGCSIGQGEKVVVLKSPSDYDADAWTVLDQKAVENEIDENSTKPIQERSYTWRLIVGLGIPQHHQTGSQLSKVKKGAMTATSDSEIKPAEIRASSELETGLQLSAVEIHSATTATSDSEIKPAEIRASSEFETGLQLSAVEIHSATTATSDSEIKPAEIRASSELPEPVVQYSNLSMRRRFVPNPHNQSSKATDAGRALSVVSYSVMHEPESDSRLGYMGFAGFVSSFGRGASNAIGKSANLWSTLPKNYNNRLFTELELLNSDVICLQSIGDCLWSKLKKHLTGLGYTGCCMNRKPGPFNFSEAIFYRTNLFTPVTSDGVLLADLIAQQVPQSGADAHSLPLYLVDRPEVAMLLTLRFKDSGLNFRIANTRCIPEQTLRPDLQAVQACSIVRMVTDLNVRSGVTMPTILCGLFDFHPDKGPYKVLRDGVMTKETEKDFLLINSSGHVHNILSLAHVYPSGLKHNMPNLRSAYSEVLGAEPACLWKKDRKKFGCGSFIWFDQAQLEVTGVLDLDTSKIDTSTEFPNQFFPSSSFALKATFRFPDDSSASEETQAELVTDDASAKI